MTTDFARRDFLKASAALAAASAFSCFEIASAAPIAVPTVDKLSIKVLADSSFDQFFRPKQAGGVSITPLPRGGDYRKPVHSEWGLSLWLESQAASEQRICPTDLQAIGLALDKLGADGDSVQPLFITVDPERDTAEHLADYVKMFHPRLIGLTGSAEAIRKAADAYKVYYAKVDPPKEDGGYYTVDHTAYIYLMDREGNYLGFFPPGTSADRMVEIIRPRLGETAR